MVALEYHGLCLKYTKTEIVWKKLVFCEFTYFNVFDYHFNIKKKVMKNKNRNLCIVVKLLWLGKYSKKNFHYILALYNFRSVWHPIVWIKYKFLSRFFSWKLFFILRADFVLYTNFLLFYVYYFLHISIYDLKW